MSQVFFPLIINHNLEVKFNESLKRKITLLTATYALFCSFVAELISQNSVLS